MAKLAALERELGLTAFSAELKAASPPAARGAAGGAAGASMPGSDRPGAAGATSDSDSGSGTTSGSSGVHNAAAASHPSEDVEEAGVDVLAELERDMQALEGEMQDLGLHDAPASAGQGAADASGGEDAMASAGGDFDDDLDSYLAVLDSFTAEQGEGGDGKGAQ